MPDRLTSTATAKLGVIQLIGCVPLPIAVTAARSPDSWPPAAWGFPAIALARRPMHPPVGAAARPMDGGAAG